MNQEPQTPNPEPNFEPENILSDPLFHRYVDEEITKIKARRKSRPIPKAGYYYKRDWYDRMEDLGHINATLFIKNIEDIWNKKSSLNSEMRNVIQFVCNEAIRKTILKYATVWL